MVPALSREAALAPARLSQRESSPGSGGEAVTPFDGSSMNGLAEAWEYSETKIQSFRSRLISRCGEGPAFDLVAFGSLARHGASEQSDLDFALVANQRTGRMSRVL